jgi:ABC-type branched-subunit amino acid transport system substrate-binding protein
MAVGVALLMLLSTSIPPVAAAPGVSKTIIKIGLHAPLTGASPVPSASVDRGKDLYFRWLKRQGRDIHGRNVQVIVKNDQYNPSTAAAVCKEMVETDHVLMIFGIGGADPMRACAQYASSVGVPYVGAGNGTLGFKNLDTYFATTMTWRAQGRLLADYFVARRRAGARKNGVVYFDSPSFSEPVGPFKQALGNRDADLDYQRAFSRTAGVAEARAAVQEMKLAGIQNAFIQATPIWFLQLLNQANEQSYEPTWMGIDSGVAHNTLMGPGCRGGGSLDGARFFSGYPAIADSDRFDPNFRRAVAKLEPGSNPDDYMWELWALDRVIAKMLNRTGRRLTRDRFVARVERTDKIKTGIGPTLRYSRRDHFGASSTHVLRADCSDERWHTAATFKRHF